MFHGDSGRNGDCWLLVVSEPQLSPSTLHPPWRIHEMGLCLRSTCATNPLQALATAGGFLVSPIPVPSWIPVELPAYRLACRNWILKTRPRGGKQSCITPLLKLCAVRTSFVSAPPQWNLFRMEPATPFTTRHTLYHPPRSDTRHPTRRPPTHWIGCPSQTAVRVMGS